MVKGSDCKSDGIAFEGSNPSPSIELTNRNHAEKGFLNRRKSFLRV